MAAWRHASRRDAGGRDSDHPAAAAPSACAIGEGKRSGRSAYITGVEVPSGRSGSIGSAAGAGATGFGAGFLGAAGFTAAFFTAAFFGAAFFGAAFLRAAFLFGAAFLFAARFAA
jgi:hypothetical protein